MFTIKIENDTTYYQYRQSDNKVDEKTLLGIFKPSVFFLYFEVIVLLLYFEDLCFILFDGYRVGYVKTNFIEMECLFIIFFRLVDFNIQLV